MEKNAILSSLFIFLLISPCQILAAAGNQQEENKRQALAIPAVYVGAVVSPAVWLSLLAAYGAAALYAASVSKSCILFSKIMYPF